MVARHLSRRLSRSLIALLLLTTVVLPYAAFDRSPTVHASGTAPLQAADITAPNFTIAHVDVAPGPYYATDGLTFHELRTLTQLDVTITVQTADGTIPAGDQANFQVTGGAITQSIVDSGSSITYYFHLTPPAVAYPDANPYPSVVAQFNPNGNAHPSANDTYEVSGLASGQPFSYSGTFASASVPASPAAITSSPYLNSNNGGYSEEDIGLTVSRALTSLSVTVTVASGGQSILNLGQYNSLPVAAQVVTSTASDRLTYAWSYLAQPISSTGKMAYIGPGIYTLAAQFSPKNNPHIYANDSYVLTASSGGATYTQQGTFAAGDPPTATPTPTPTATSTQTPTPTMTATPQPPTATATATPYAASTPAYPRATPTKAQPAHRTLALRHNRTRYATLCPGGITYWTHTAWAKMACTSGPMNDL